MATATACHALPKSLNALLNMATAARSTHLGTIRRLTIGPSSVPGASASSARAAFKVRTVAARISTSSTSSSPTALRPAVGGPLKLGTSPGGVRSMVVLSAASMWAVVCAHPLKCFTLLACCGVIVSATLNTKFDSLSAKCDSLSTDIATMRTDVARLEGITKTLSDTTGTLLGAALRK